jgi:hypothetical protein
MVRGLGLRLGLVTLRPYECWVVMVVEACLSDTALPTNLARRGQELVGLPLLPQVTSDGKWGGS